MDITLDVINNKRANFFFDRYHIQKIIDCNLKSKVFLKSSFEKICRFCKKKHPEVSFKNDAHVIPQLLGNKFLLSNFECDSCNSKFSSYEASLASFLGPFRTFAQIKGQKGKGIPKFKNSKTGLKIYSENNDIYMEVINDKFKDEIEIDENNKIFTVTTEKQSYVPINAYRSLLKIGLSLIDDNEVEEYEHAFDFLNSSLESLSSGNYPFARLISYFIPMTLFKYPFAILFRKKNNKEVIFTHTLIIGFPNHLYQIFIPYKKSDYWMYKKDIIINFPIVPLIALSSEDKILLLDLKDYKYSNISLSNTEKVKSDPYQIQFSFNHIKIDDFNKKNS